MSEYRSLEEFVAPVAKEVLNENPDITAEETETERNRYELKLRNGETQARLLLNKKGNGRPVPIVSINAISEGERNLFYGDHRIDSSRKVIQDVEEALQIMVKSLASN